MVKSYTKLMAGALLSLGVLSCVDEDYDMSNLNNEMKLKMNLSAPLGRSTITIGDLLDKAEVEGLVESSDGGLVIEYDTVSRTVINPFEINLPGSEFEYDMKELDIFQFDETREDFKDLNIPGVLLEEIISKVPDDQWPKLEAGQVFELPFKLGIAVDDEEYKARIDKIEVKEAVLKMRIGKCGIEGLTDKVKLELEMPKYVSDGKFIWDERAREAVLNLNNATLDLSKSESESKDSIEFVLKVIITKDIVFKPTSDLGISLETDDATITYKAIYGAVEAVSPQNEICDLYLDLYGDSKVEWDLNVLEPQIEVSARTNCGMPLAGHITRLVAKNTQKDDSVVANFNGKTEYDMNFQNATGKGEVLAFEAKFDKDNGSLDKLINSKPDSLLLRCSYKVDGYSEDPTKSYYMLDTTYIDMHLKASVPLALGGGTKIAMSDTTDGIDLKGDMEDYESGDYNIDEAELMLEIENGIPLDAVVTVSFLHADTVRITGKRGDDAVKDVDYKVIYEELSMGDMEKKYELVAAEVDGNRKVVRKSSKKWNVHLRGDVVDVLKKLNAVKYHYDVSVPNGKEVHISKDCTLGAKVYVQCKGSFVINGNKDK